MRCAGIFVASLRDSAARYYYSFHHNPENYDSTAGVLVQLTALRDPDAKGWVSAYRSDMGSCQKYRWVSAGGDTFYVSQVEQSEKPIAGADQVIGRYLRRTYADTAGKKPTSYAQGIIATTGRIVVQASYISSADQGSATDFSLLEDLIKKQLDRARKLG